jgi:hypothetical protein
MDSYLARILQISKNTPLVGDVANIIAVYRNVRTSASLVYKGNPTHQALTEYDILVRDSTHQLGLFHAERRYTHIPYTWHYISKLPFIIPNDDSISIGQFLGYLNPCDLGQLSTETYCARFYDLNQNEWGVFYTEGTTGPHLCEFVQHVERLFRNFTQVLLAIDTSLNLDYRIY